VSATDETMAEIDAVVRQARKGRGLPATRRAVEKLLSQQRKLLVGRRCAGRQCPQCRGEYLDRRKAERTLNNNGIPRIVRNYFLELVLVILECARVLKPTTPFVMVNDNVQYAGARAPVDVILSDIPEHIGFDTQVIWTLPRGKGNSSQRMRRHGRQVAAGTHCCFLSGAVVKWQALARRMS